MKFGAVPLDEALGAVLAHSVAVTGERLRKGRVLSETDLAKMRAIGVSEVIVARLDPGDVDENTAAAELAAAIKGTAPGLTPTAAFTGRVNLLADGAGIAVLDVNAINAVNAVHPMITIATVPPHHQLATGGMAATIKIISYAVARADLDAACRAAGGGAMRLAQPKLKTATLIITEIPGGVGDKGRKAIAARLEALNVTLEDIVMVPHETAALARAIDEAKSDLVLVLTGSATSDVQDVAPSAVRQAGGEVVHFGMPVDPGNLLFIGRHGRRPVIGLPGCARSPALNGADWVLSRIICGIAVNGADIAAMGVGGLLKEIPTRPQPRRGS